MRILLAAFATVLAASATGCAPREEDPGDSASLEGNWVGTADAGAVQMRLRLVVADIDGVLHATVTSLTRWHWEIRATERLSLGLGAPVASINGETISVPMSDWDASYTGTWSRKDGRIDGTFSQAGETFPIVLERSSEEAETESRRPQTPREPFPYLAEDVTFPNPEGGHTLAGTFTRPTSGGPFPAVILIPGSGPYARLPGETGHRPLHVLADHLTRRGIAVLYYDKRGLGESTGDFRAATTEDFASDALAGVAYLKAREDVDAGRIGLAGQSEGGLIAPMAAVRSSDVGYIVLLAGPGVNGERIQDAQLELRGAANGVSEETIAEFRQRQDAINEILKSEDDPARAREAIEAIIRTRLERARGQARRMYGIRDEASLARVVSEQVQGVNTPWRRFFLTYDPAPTLEQVTVPVLAINGTKDLFVPHEENLREIEAALKRGGNTRYEIHAIPDLNHLFQHAKTGTLWESETIDETFAPEVLDLIASWILRTVEG
ncbi:MAG: alpha/beta hydrolase [Gemmatimonadetes bacterium]|nr:alpha/beta hydrolase [Gemmatimonadota bacterium]